MTLCWSLTHTLLPDFSFAFTNLPLQWIIIKIYLNTHIHSFGLIFSHTYCLTKWNSGCHTDVYLLSHFNPHSCSWRCRSNVLFFGSYCVWYLAYSFLTATTVLNKQIQWQLSVHNAYTHHNLSVFSSVSLTATLFNQVPCGFKTVRISPWFLQELKHMALWLEKKRVENTYVWKI